MNITTHFCSTSKSRHKNAADYWHRTTVYKRLDKLQATSKSGIEIGSLSQWGGRVWFIYGKVWIKWSPVLDLFFCRPYNKYNVYRRFSNKREELFSAKLYHKTLEWSIVQDLFYQKPPNK